MPQSLDFKQLVNEIGNLRKYLGKSAGRIRNAQHRTQFGQLLNEIDKQFAELQDAYPQATAALHDKHEDVKRAHEKNKADLGQLKQKVAVAKQAKETPSAPAGMGVQVNLPKHHGAQLRRELLDRFGPPAAPQDDARSVMGGAAWQDWNLDALEQRNCSQE